MNSSHSHIQENAYIFLRLPTETLKLIEIKLNTIIDVGKLGSFPSNLLLGRPCYHTYEILEKRLGEQYARLRIVPQAELNAEAGLDDAQSGEAGGGILEPDVANVLPSSYDLLADDPTLKTNQLTVDDSSRQTLSHAEIEELKKSAAGKEVIERILASHTGLDEKTIYSKAKYMLRKRTKYLKRFTVLPMDLGTLIEYIMEKEPSRIMELREESLGLITAWSNIHFSGFDPASMSPEENESGYGRWLVADDTGGLVVAALAERMNILRGPSAKQKQKNTEQSHAGTSETNGDTQLQSNGIKTAKQAQLVHRDFPIPSRINAITLLHAAVQPNVSILKYFGYDTSNSTVQTLENEHPLHTQLKPLSWLQLLHPNDDPTYTEPELASEDTIASWKSGKRGTYFKKRRRWERCKAIVDETREGGFDGLVVASHLDLVGILQHTIPLIRGGGQVVIYSPTIEPLVRIIDLFSKERRSAYITQQGRGDLPDIDDFPLDPRMLLGPSLQTSRMREWQVLPGRTHPLMTSKGGAEGYVFTATKVIPLDGGVEARGNFYAKKRKVAASEPAVFHASEKEQRVH